MAQHDVVFRVPPLSTVRIRKVADNLRTAFKIERPYFPVADVVELVFPHIISDYVFELCTKSEMDQHYGRGVHAMAIPTESRIVLRDDIYDGLLEENPRDRFTVAHEIGHFILHHGVGFARGETANAVKPYENSEWQADTFAAELLMPIAHALQCASVQEIMTTFGVSNLAAKIRWETLKKFKVHEEESPSGNSGFREKKETKL